MKIIRLSVDSFMRLRAVEISPTGHMVTITGANANGKSSVLNAIWSLFGGTSTLPEVPIRKGRDKSEIEADLGDIIVRRTITKGGTTLTITGKDGVKLPGGPQGILDKLVGRLTFDPLDFSRKTKEEQATVLRDLVGLDFNLEDQKRVADYNQRTQVGREVKALDARLAIFPSLPESTPDVEKSAAEVLERQNQAQQKNQENNKKRSGIEQLYSRARTLARDQGEEKAKIKKLQDDLAAAEKRLSATAELYRAACLAAEEAEQATESLVDEPMESFATELQDLEHTNRQVRAKQERKKIADELAAKRKEYSALERSLENIDEFKRKKTSEAKFPIAGLSFSEDGGVLFNALPFSQASSAEQLRVSLAIGCALNPKLRVLLIRDGSLLDENNLKLVGEICKENDFQAWIESVTTTDPAAVVIEDGAVKE